MSKLCVYTSQKTMPLWPKTCKQVNTESLNTTIMKRCQPVKNQISNLKKKIINI